MKPARIETNPETGEVRVTFPGHAFQALAEAAEVISHRGLPKPGDEVLSEDYRAHLERADADGSGRGSFVCPPLHTKAPDVRQSAAQALAHRGYVTMIRVKVRGRVLAWAAPITPEGRRTAEEYRHAGPGAPS